MLHKHYGGIDYFDDKSILLLVKCLENAIKKENAIFEVIGLVLGKMTGQQIVPEIPKMNNTKKMRNAEDIMADYGLGGE